MGRRTEREREPRPKEGALCAVRRAFAAPFVPFAAALRKKRRSGPQKKRPRALFLKHVCVFAAKRVKAGGICFIVLFAALGIGFCKLCHGTVALRN